MAMGSRYRLERIVASAAERVLFQAQDELLRRPVSIRVNFYLDDAVRAWFMRESEALGQLDDRLVTGGGSVLDGVPVQKAQRGLSVLAGGPLQLAHDGAGDEHLALAQ